MAVSRGLKTCLSLGFEEIAAVEEGWRWRRRIWRIQEGGGSCLLPTASLLRRILSTTIQRYRFLFCGCGANAAVVGDLEGEDDVDCSVDDVFEEKVEKGGKAGPWRLSLVQIEAMTGRFTSAVVGEGGFSTVYLVRLSGALVAVKVHRSSERLHRVFRQELDTLLCVCQPHIVRLLAFCDQQEEGVIVLEFVANENLHERLHGGGKVAWTMPWARRVSVARALEYMHDRCEPQVVHGDAKASNALLGALLSGGGRARRSLQSKHRRSGVKWQAKKLQLMVEKTRRSQWV
ncbi:hypothetical protein EJB05_05725, partial [Eragrostis curvula]